MARSFLLTFADKEKMISKLKIALDSDVDTIVSLLSDMQSEVREVEIDKNITKESVSRSLKEHVYWLLFEDEKQNIFGTCYLQSVHNYWQIEKRFYLGGFYIVPSHRKQGRFKELNRQLKEWAIDRGGVQIYCHIHENNEESLNAFAAVNIRQTEYKLCVHHWG